MGIVACVLAGGLSQRMGQDKSAMFGGVARLQGVLHDAGIERTVVLCGSQERTSMFDGEVLADPEGVEGLHELIPWIRSTVQGDLLLIPCDAFLLNKEAVRVLLQSAPAGGVPMDSTGQRQPLFAFLPSESPALDVATSVRELLQHLPSIDVGEHAFAYSNFNTQDEVDAHQRSLLGL
ncbi:MAG: molybdenum cofactor guanylyltransferase [Poseidonia sp.]